MTSSNRNPPPPSSNNDLEQSQVGSAILLITPEEIKEFLKQYEKENEKKGKKSEEKKSDSSSRDVDDDDDDYENVDEQEHEPLSGFFGSIRARVLRLIGRILLRIKTLDMHGGTTGDNTQVVHGLVDFLGGSLGGAAQVYVSQPLDTVKVKQQTFPERYKSMVDCFMETYRKDGIHRGLYAGSVPAVIANVAENSVLFAAYGGCQSFVGYLVNKDVGESLTTLENAFAGFFAAFFSTFTLCPTELIKCKLQSLREMRSFVEPGMAKLRTPWSLTRYIYKQEGISGFYRGLSTTFIREMPGYFFFFGGYEGTRELLRKPDQSKDDIGALRTMVAGAIGGVTLWTSTFPADVIKSRIQVKNLNQGMVAVGIDIVRREGVTALYTGLLPSILRTIPATATLFVVYEYTKKTLLGTM